MACLQSRRASLRSLSGASSLLAEIVRSIRFLLEGLQCHIGVMRMMPSHAKKRTKKEKRRKICLTRFDQNLLTSLDLARLRQFMIKLNSRLLTEGLLVRI